MPDAPEVAIEGALLAHAQAFANAQSLTISMPNRPFVAPADKSTASGGSVAYGKWIRASFVPADTETLALGVDDANKHYGFLQLDIFYGQGAGELAPARIAADAISYFERGTELERDGIVVRILRQPFRRPSIKDDPWLIVPVRILYCCFANPA